MKSDEVLAKLISEKKKELERLVDGGIEELSKYSGKYAAILGGKVIAADEYLNRLQQNWRVGSKRNSGIRYVQDLIPCTTILSQVKKEDCVETYIPNF